VATHCDPICVDWAWFDDAALTEPFFESAVHRAMGRPFNRLFRYRIALDDLVANVPSPLSLPPNGFIFHMSRCGSTLAAQMLATRERSIVISEAPPIDAVVQLARATPHWPAERHPEFLRAIIAAYGRRRRGDENQFFVKLDSWHTLALPLFRRAFAGVPWLFLYRNPVEVLVSQMRQRGSQMVPEIMPPAFYGIDNADGPQGVEYCARVLNKICTAALTGCIDDGGLPVNYDELPGAVESRILPHFGLSATPPERDAMALAARRDAKNPTFDFSRDTEAKQSAASDVMRATAERHLGDVYRKLEALRAAS
jgi:hypothetical protein